MTIFVFGSNTSGRHGAGAAKTAVREWGAIRGQGEGRQGRSYAIPTKGHALRARALPAIQASVRTFLAYAAAHPELQFRVTRIGCGLAGYTDQQIAPMFRGASANCQLPEGWRG